MVKMQHGAEFGEPGRERPVVEERVERVHALAQREVDDGRPPCEGHDGQSAGDDGADDADRTRRRSHRVGVGVGGRFGAVAVRPVTAVVPPGGERRRRRDAQRGECQRQSPQFAHRPDADRGHVKNRSCEHDLDEAGPRPAPGRDQGASRRHRAPADDDGHDREGHGAAKERGVQLLARTCESLTIRTDVGTSGRNLKRFARFVRSGPRSAVEEGTEVSIVSASAARLSARYG